MRVLIDADGCPVVRETVRQCAAFHVPCLLFCDTAHVFSIPGVEVFVADCGHDSTDYLLLAEGEAAAAPVAAPAAKKWPTAHRVWLVILIVALLAQIGLRIWGSVAMGKAVIYGGGQVYSEAVTALYYLNDRYNLTWLTLLVYGMTIAGFVGTVLYKPVREFLRGEVLGEKKG